MLQAAAVAAEAQQVTQVLDRAAGVGQRPGRNRERAAAAAAAGRDGGPPFGALGAAWWCLRVVVRLTGFAAAVLTLPFGSQTAWFAALSTSRPPEQTDLSYGGMFSCWLIPGWFGPSHETHGAVFVNFVVRPPPLAGTPGAPVVAS